MFVALFAVSTNGLSQAQPKREKWDGGVLVWSRGTRLEALRAGQKVPSVLRSNFQIPSRWNFSFDGEELTFADTPQDVDFFNAGAYRNYLFLARFNARPKVLLAAYGPKSLSDYDYQTPSFDRSGRKIVVDEGEIGQFMDDSSARWVAIYDIKTRRSVFDSRQIIQKMAPGETREILRKVEFRSPALSPDGQDLVALATPDDGDSIANDLKPEEKAPPTLLVHFDLKRKTAEILSSIDDQLSVGRYSTEGNTTRSEAATRFWNPQFAWHPTQKIFVFPGPAAPSNPVLNLFAFDLRTRASSQITCGDFLDTSPQWTLDGKSVVWLRRPIHPSEAPNQIFRAGADGKGARSILPQIRGATQIQIVPQIANWTRFRKSPVQALAGVDK